MEEQITETLIESPYPFWITIILFAVISGLIQCIISFFIERGKNLATKKDISDITNKIESVKDSYNKALEAHKIELQKEFESHKYIMTLCHSLDNTLLQYIASCLKADAEKGIIYPDNDNSLIKENNKLSNFLYTYKGRYDSIPVLYNLRIISGEIDADNENLNLRISAGYEEGIINQIPSKQKKLLITALNEALMYFIPALVPDNHINEDITDQKE